MIIERVPGLRWIRRNGKLVLQYRTSSVSIRDATDKEIEDFPQWRDVPVEDNPKDGG
jgi:hypothetical protein